MAKPNKTRYALLGMLSIQPMSGYDIKKNMDGSVGNFWNENYGHIYPMLRRLESEGLVTKNTEHEGKTPPKNVYTLTESGKRELHAWLDTPPEPQPLRNELLLQLFFGKELSREGLLAKINAEKQRQLARKQTYEVIFETVISPQIDHPDAFCQLMTLRYGFHNSEAIIAWCDECEQELLKKS